MTTRTDRRSRHRLAAFIAAVLVWTPSLVAQQGDTARRTLTAEDYARAERFMTYNTAPLVSVDFNHDPASSTFDSTLTKVSGRLVKVSSWYDNEWGFSNRMLDVTAALMNAR